MDPLFLLIIIIVFIAVVLHTRETLISGDRIRNMMNETNSGNYKVGTITNKVFKLADLGMSEARLFCKTLLNQ